MSDQNALLRFLAAQQMMGLSTNQGGISSNQGNSNRNNSNQSNNLAAAMAGFGAMNPQMIMWQNMMLAQQQAQALAMVQAAQQVSQQPTCTTATSTVQQNATFEDAMRKLAAASQKTTPSVVKSVSTPKTVSNVASPSETPSPSKLEPGEVPKKNDPLLATLSTPSPSPSVSSSTTATPSGNSVSPAVAAFAQSMKTQSKGGINPALAALAQSMGGNGVNQNVMGNALWQLLASQFMQQQSKSNTVPKTKKENGFASSHSVNMSRVKEEQADNEGGENGRKKHIVTDINAVRKPLDYGWRRQTCIRTISANGLRGDVVYYAPCGKKLSTYAEVIRYLQKTGAGGGEITRDHFSFSCKMIVGEFVMFKVHEITGEKIIAKMAEEEVLTEMQKLVKPKPPPKEPKLHEPKLKKVKKEEKEEEEFFDHGEEEYESPPRDLDETKGSRIPIDDLLLEEVRPLPDLPRIENLQLKGNGFADALMVYEFLQNFHHVLKVEKDSLPTLGALCAGLAGEQKYRNEMMNVAKTLLTLCLEYPGLPRKDRDLFRQQAGELEMSRDNFSEMMRLLLQSRDKCGQELAIHLETATYEALDGDKKSAILAFMCNELLYCRNIVREIDSNLEEIGRMRGDRWMREGKVRALRAVHARKKKKGEREKNIEEGDRPDSRHSEHSDGSRPASPTIPSRAKVLTPGIGQCEVLTEEEENMCVEDLAELITSLNEEAENIRDSVNALHTRVRTFPLGQDRFHRFYWQLPNVPAVLVESVESGAVKNSAVNLEETCSHDPPGVTEPSSYTDPDVLACMEDLIDGVIMGGRQDKKRKRRVRRLENISKRGWWTVERDNIKPLRDSLHGRGIRERALHRLLLRERFLAEQKWNTLSVDPVSSRVSLDSINKEELNRAERAVRSLESRVAESSLQVPGWRPPFEPFDEDDVSRDSWVDAPSPSMIEIYPAPSLDSLQSRLLNLEENIERRYLRQHFHAGETISARKVLGKEEKKESEVDDERKDEEGEEEDRDVEEEREVRDVWREAVSDSKTASKIILTAQVLEQCIAWERSVMKASCQICRTSDHEEKLLICDLCEMGYHLYCFRPPMKEVPNGSWYCPKCKETASNKPTCLLCSQQNTPIYGCVKCYSFFHSECAGEPTPESIRQYKCATCDASKKTSRILEHHADSRAVSEVSDETLAVPTKSTSENRRNGVKRKAPEPTPVVFPTSMVADLARTMLDEMEAQSTCGPFLEPVDPRDVPEYRQVIEHPIDMQTMRDNADAGRYETPEEFHSDVDLMFSNCRTFNEDSSPIGQAGINLNKFFTKRWRQVKYNFSKRLKRMRPSDKQPAYAN